MPSFYGIPSLQAVTEAGQSSNQNIAWSGQHTFSNGTFGARFNTNVPVQFSSAGNWSVLSDATNLIFQRNSGTGGCRFTQHASFMDSTPTNTTILFSNPSSSTLTRGLQFDLTHTGSTASLRALSFTMTAAGTSLTQAPTSLCTASIDANPTGTLAMTATGLAGIGQVASSRTITNSGTIDLTGLSGSIGSNANTHTNVAFRRVSVRCQAPPTYTLGAGASDVSWALRIEGEAQINDDQEFIFGGSNTTKATNRMSWVSASSVLRTEIGGATFWDLSSTTQTYADAKDIAFNTTTGTKIGTGITQKIGFYGATPIVQRSGAAQAAVATTAATNVAPFGFTSAAQADAIVTLVNELRAWAVAQGFIKGSA